VWGGGEGGGWGGGCGGGVGGGGGGGGGGACNLATITSDIMNTLFYMFHNCDEVLHQRTLHILSYHMTAHKSSRANVSKAKVHIIDRQNIRYDRGKGFAV